jgi:AcrR family transcriptional regulator
VSTGRVADEPDAPPAGGTGTAAPPTGGRQLLSRADRQAQLLRAAATAFARGGFAATSMEDVAAEAGVTKLIVYRNFDSKEDLYRSVLDGVLDRLREEWLREVSLPEDERHGFTSRALLTVARENPDGFRLLMVHAAREPQFAPIAEEFTEGARGVAGELMDDLIPDPTVKAWAVQVVFAYLVNGVLAWLEVGDPDEDEAFVERATRGMAGMFVGWTDDTVAGSDVPPTT